jgi:phthalate 4,5-cis-dihydrodiol dehydrogenase
MSRVIDSDSILHREGKCANRWIRVGSLEPLGIQFDARWEQWYVWMDCKEVTIAMVAAHERPIRFGIAGLGAGASNALSETPGLASHPHVKLTAAADLRQVALDQFVADFGGETFTSVEAMCASPNVDAVYILTPSRLHAEHAIIAAEHGKQVLLDKPMALTIEDAERVVRAVERNGVRLLVGHSQSLDIGILKMAEIVRQGDLGRPLMLHTSFFSDWLYRPRAAEELDPANGDNLALRQGPIQIDIARLICGGLVRNVRAMTSIVDPARPIEGSLVAYLDFEDGTPAILEYNGYGHFDSSELTWGIGLHGNPRDPEDNLRSRRQVASMRPEEEWAFKDATRYGGGKGRRQGRPLERHQFFGFTLVSCENGDIRQTQQGLMIYADNERRELTMPMHLYAETELDIMYRAWANHEPLEYHDAAWGMATLEVALGILQSARERREIAMSHQTVLPSARASSSI